MRIVACDRASTEDQQVTIDAQRDKLAVYAELHDHELVETVAAIDSAKNLDREGLRFALSFLSCGNAEGCSS